MKLSLKKPKSQNFLALAFALPCAGMLFVMLISQYEPHNRGAYGGCIGYIGLNGNLNQAITIRTFVARNGELWFQAGGGIVAKSNEDYELQEVNNKLGALRRAIAMAEQM